jgi:hypothetical protein
MLQIFKSRRITELDDALKLEWHAKNSIIAYVLSNMSSQILQNWSDTVLDVLHDWPRGKPYLALYDLSHSGVALAYVSLVKRRVCSLGITKTGEARALESINQRENLNSRVAVYTSRTYSGHVSGFLAEIDARRFQVGRVVRYEAFYSREAALDWLEKK